MAVLVRFRLCSVLSAETGGRSLSGRDLGSRKARTLLALLVAARGRLVPLDEIVEVLWPRDPPADPGANVATLVSRARRLLGPGVLAGSGAAYGVVPGAVSVDLDEAATLCREARSRLRSLETAPAGAAARRALDLLGAPPCLPDEPDTGWTSEVRREADELRREARHLLATATTRTSPGDAADASAAAVAVDPYDERAVRDLMRALVGKGATAAALATYADLVARLREELGTDPGAPTTRLHLAILREEALPTEEEATPRGVRPVALVGRDEELATVDAAWVRACAGRGGLMLVEGVGGIGKTALLDATADLAASTGGLVLRGRCHPAERSLFLQPYVDALRPWLLARGAGELATLLEGHTAAWASMLPEVRAVLEVRPAPRAAAATERRRVYDAVAAVLRRTAQAHPVLLCVDDLQDGGAASVDLLAYLGARLVDAPVLLVGAARPDAARAVARLTDRAAVRVRLGTLTPGAVRVLASGLGLGDRAEEVMARTAGHALSVVECLEGLRADEDGVPGSLASAVLARVDRLPAGPRELVQGASVLRGRLEPRLLGDLLGLGELVAVRHCESLALAGLLRRVDRHYEFANDLFQECVRESLAPALAAAHHRRAADLLGDQPEAMAEHAHAAGDRGRAAHGWLLAGQAAMARSAVEDAVGLYGRALAAGEEPALRGRVLLARAEAHEASTAYDAGLVDAREALGLARRAGDRRLEMSAHRALGGDIPVGLHGPMSEVGAHLQQGLRLATALGDRRAEADLTTRLVVLESSRLRLTSALARAEASLARARASASPEAVVLALDGVKNVLGYLGDTERLPEVAAELEPHLRASGSTWLLQWAVFEGSLAHAGAGRWAEAEAGVQEALDVNRLSGFTAYAGYFRAHLGWFRRLAGDLDGALEHGRRAVADTSPVDHPWWYATAVGLLAGTLLEHGGTSEAAGLARRGLAAAGPDAPEAWRLRCLAPLAAALVGTDAEDAEDVRVRGTRLLEEVDCPAGRAWVVGADCYLLLARAAWQHGDPTQARRLLAPLASAVTRRWDAVRACVDAELAQISSATSRAARAAPSVGTGT